MAVNSTHTRHSFEIDCKNELKSGRNYELDFLKLVMAVLVFVTHTHSFVSKDSSLYGYLTHFGPASVQFFFIISGMLMANSIVKQGEVEDCGKRSAQYVVNKYKGMFLPLTVALFIVIVIQLAVKILSGTSVSNCLKYVINAIPEFFMVQLCGTYVAYNRPVWYISAMLLCMLPLAYMLFRRKQFTLYVFAPITALCTLGFMSQTDVKWSVLTAEKMYGAVTGGVIRGMCGLCFGICAYTIYDKIKNMEFDKQKRIKLTVLEVFLYAVYYFVLIFSRFGNQSYMTVWLLLPIAIAITFSGKSYVARLFEFRWMRFFAPLSLSIYLNHHAARVVVTNFYPGRGYLQSSAIMAVYTVGFCLLNYIVVSAIKRLRKKGA